MISNYLKIAWRNMWKKKGFSFLNIFGLAIGITAAILIFLWVEDEMNYDASFSNKANIYSVIENQSYEGEWRTFGSTPGPLAAAMTEEIPGVAKASRTREADLLFSLKDKRINEKGLYADPSFLDIFQLKFLQGTKKDALDGVNSIIITQKVAHQFFGEDNNIIGKSIKIDNNENYHITGVIPDFPDNTTLKFDWITSFEAYATGKNYLDEWGNNSVETYVSLNPEANVASVDAQLRNFLEKKTGDAETKAFLFAMEDWHLRADFKDGKQVGGDILYVRLFAIIAWIILIIACINFMNLSTAKSENRANDVGVRKVLGANKSSLFVQFISESFLMTFIGVALSVLLVAMILPSFNLLVDKQLSLGLTEPKHLLVLMLIAVFCGILAGSYPALYMASLKPIVVLKGKKIASKNANVVRKILVVTQFSISVALIIGTILVYQQIQHVQSRQLGYDKEGLISMDVQGDMIKNFESIRNELIKTKAVENVGLSSYGTLNIGNNTSSVDWRGKDETSDILVSHRLISPGFFETLKMKVVAGRNFRENEAADTTKVIITSSMAKLMDIDPVVGQDLRLWGDKVEVVGVIEDYLYGDMYGKSDPVIFFNYPEGGRYLYIRMAKNVPVSEALTTIQNVMETYNPAYPFSYQFVDKAYQAKFKSELLVGKLSRIFAGLAILISCLGLFGLAAYMAEQRKKEIGVRKVLGASVRGLVQLLSKDFLKLVGMSCIIAFPLAWYVMHNWLQDFAYRVTISWWVFAVAGFLALAIALVTVSFQAIKAAIANPVKSLRTE